MMWKEETGGGAEGRSYVWELRRAPGFRWDGGRRRGRGGVSRRRWGFRMLEKAGREGEGQGGSFYCSCLSPGL